LKLAYESKYHETMAKAARAIIIEDDKILVMFRNKQGSQYYTLVGGRVQDSETLEQGLIREVKEETGLEVTSARQVYSEDHPEPYNQQYIFLCEIAAHGDTKLQEYSEEEMLNQMQTNIHEPMWVPLKAFQNLPFRTPQLQEAINHALRKGFPKESVQL